MLAVRAGNVLLRAFAIPAIAALGAGYWPHSLSSSGGNTLTCKKSVVDSGISELNEITTDGLRHQPA